MRFTAAVVTISDKGAAGERADDSGDLLERLLMGFGAGTVSRTIVPDEQEKITETLIQLCGHGADLIITNGGTGLGPRDITPEATLDVIERQAPGFTETMRTRSLAITPRAMLSRAVAGTRGRTLIINFPGSPKACEESFAVIEPALGHALELLAGRGRECGR
ncbi:molybdopterin adenylyltransferase [bacterium BMS3Abin01]|nr:molybdopterin adenylyltransferase [bacterium BMS3Abin01]HDZ59941.1 MogA/MoaB family molybdenum cofactor biosynthesis protein [Actinomycetota bacterium]